VEIQDEKKNVNVAQVWKSTTLSPHIFTISQTVDAELMQRGEHEEINQFGEFVEENFNILVEVPTPKRKANRISTLDIDYWGLICKAQEMVDVEINPIDVSSNEDDIEIEETGKHMDICKDETCIILLFGCILDQVLDDAIEVDRTKRRLLNYHWREDTLFFKNLMVPKLEERKALVKDIHEEIRHYNEGRTLAEVKKRFFWHDKIEFVRTMVRQCQRCQLAKSSRSIKSSIEEMKNILVCDLFYKVALNTIGPLPKTKYGNRYALVAIDHYSKWCEARHVKLHDAANVARFLEEEIICKFGVPKFIFMDNGSEWMAEFDLMCKKYGIIYQFTTP
jgi:hypothetical protein